MQKKCIQLNLPRVKQSFCLSLHYNGAKIIKFKAKDSETVATPLCLGNISKDWSIDNMGKTVLSGYVYDFSVDYNAIEVDDILDVI